MKRLQPAKDNRLSIIVGRTRCSSMSAKEPALMPRKAAMLPGKMRRSTTLPVGK